MLLAIVGLGAAVASASDADTCERACLEGHVNAYLAALSARDPKRLPLADDVRFTENGAVLELGEGMWKTAEAVTDYRIYVADVPGGQAGFIGTIEQAGKLMMLAIQKDRAARSAVVPRADDRRRRPELRRHPRG
jgi:hypothetical protein